MANELDERRKMDRAARAKALVSDPLVVEFFIVWHGAIFEAWMAARDPAQREATWNLMQASRKLRQHLEGIIGDGKVSERIIEDMIGRPAA